MRKMHLLRITFYGTIILSKPVMLKSKNSCGERSLSKCFIFLVALVLVAAIFSSALAQNQVTIIANRDNTLYEITNGVASNGAGEYFFAGRTAKGERRRGLLFFDIASSIPAGATINSVSLKLHMSKTNPAGTAQFIKLHHVLADWGEGGSNAALEEGAGAPPTTGDATWSHRFFNTTMWTNPGGDFATEVSDSESVGQVDFYTWGPTPLMVKDVQRWLDTPASNFGWLIVGNETTSLNAKRFDTRENTNPAFRPELTVTYDNSTVGVESDQSRPLAFALHEIFPNPLSLSASAHIRYELPRPSPVRLVVYNLLGEKIRTLVDTPQTAGVKQITWDGTNDAGARVATGMYLYRIEAGAFAATRKLAIIR
jgi:hypothetical protein